MKKAIKVIDLFAGPGGLGEGFSSFKKDNEQKFKIAISIEKEESAHRTLTLRAFLRQFGDTAPEEYYSFLKGEMSDSPEKELFQLPKFKEELSAANNEAQQITLSKETENISLNKILQAVGDDDSILIGGPPCQAYSLVGRARNYGDKEKVYDAQSDHRNFLYLEYLKVIAKFQPLVFVMENVKGILSAKVDGKLIFDSILNDLEDPCKSSCTSPFGERKKHKYKIVSFVCPTKEGDLFNDEFKFSPKDYVIKTEEYGIPQARHRVILLGIREDLVPKHGVQLLKKSESFTTVSNAISDLPPLRSKLSKGGDTLEKWRTSIKEMQLNSLIVMSKDESISANVLKLLKLRLSEIETSPNSTGGNFGQIRSNFSDSLNSELTSWYEDQRLCNYVSNHETRGHIITDLHRYLYYSVYAEINNVSPKSYNLPKILWPNHNNFNSGKFADRFRVQLANNFGTTVTSHISKDGHYFIHYDPEQCRSLTVREAARIQTFPDNYHFVGNRTQQYVQVGNAVPPYLAYQLADVVYSIIST